MEPLYHDDLKPGLRLVNLAAKLLAEGRKEDAVCAAIGACELESTRPEPFVMLAGCYDQVHGMEKYQAAACREALIVNPKDSLAMHNLSLAYMRMYKWELALEYATQAHMLDPTNPYTLQQGAALFSQLGQFDEAAMLLTAALGHFTNSLLDDGSPKARVFKRDTIVSRGISKLEAGDYARYFEGYKARLEYAEPRESQAAAAFHSGRLCKVGEQVGKRITIILENGLGDQVEFARLIPVFLEAHPQIQQVELIGWHIGLAKLIARSLGLNHTFIPSTAVEGTGFMGVAQMDIIEWAWREGLPDPFGAWTGSYIKTNLRAPIRREETHISEASPKLAIGFCWQGNPNHAYDWARSMPLQAFVDWAETKRDTCTFHSLQAGEKRFPMPEWIEDCSRQEFTELIPVIQACDVIVGPDTGVLHLAGAMGKPAVMLHSFHQEWRWKLGTQIYGENFRHLKQTIRGDWNELLSRLGPELDNLLTCSLTEAMAH
jgi:tetratricopeptide (TPR) repeat protein